MLAAPQAVQEARYLSMEIGVAWQLALAGRDEEEIVGGFSFEVRMLLAPRFQPKGPRLCKGPAAAGTR